MPPGIQRSNTFTTPARDDTTAPTKESTVVNQVTPSDPDVATIRAAVTNSPLTQQDKQVRFGSGEEELTSSPSPKPAVPSGRGLVSRRGGRFSSPGNRAVKKEDETVAAEYKTYRSPQRKEDDVPSLVSSGGSNKIKQELEAEKDSNDSADSERSKTPLSSLPKLDDDSKALSPGGGSMFLAPSSPKRTSADEKMSARTPPPRERCLQTPTDFAIDYGKQPNPMSNGSFDTSNVLAWLQSPTANGLFSPGGYNNLTPNGPRTPRTPTVSTSFFFSDVAGLPKGETTPAKEDSKRKGISNIICISPLASSKRNGATPTVKDMFASPQAKSKVTSLPLLQDDTPNEKPRISQRSGSKDPNIDAVHLAERDLMEDEDMSVLLQLASNTPRSSTSASGPVFRSPNPKSGKSETENLPTLQLPMIGGNEVKSKKGGDDFTRPQLGMRTGAKSMMPSGRKEKESRNDEGDEKHGKTYPMHPPYPRGDMQPFYPPMPGMMPGGSMRVVVGVPPPKTSPTGAGMNSGSPHPPPSYYDHHPYGYSPYPPPPHVRYAYQGSYPHPPPPPQGMPMYGPQPLANGIAPGKKGVAKKTPKRPPPSTEKGEKKQRKTSTGKKKSVATPPLEGEDRQKAAACIHAVNAASGGKNDKAAAQAASALRGVTMRPSGKWQAQLYFAGKSRYIGVFDSREKAALAYEIAREKLKAGPTGDGKTTENLVNAARKAAFEGVNDGRKA